jgi:predicted nucleic acid-binding protein
MAFDPSNFSSMVITDTCSVWNVLSADAIFRAANSARVNFYVTPMVLYECLNKPRKTTTPESVELIRRLRVLRAQGKFSEQPCDLDDLLAVSRRAPAALSSGELSCIATAYKTTSFAFMTDERKARQYAEQKLQLKVETTPKLYGWLHFHRHLVDADHSVVIEEHEKHERRPLTKFFQEAYETALQYRLMSR